MDLSFSDTDDSGLDPDQPYRFPGGATTHAHVWGVPRDHSVEVTVRDCTYLGRCSMTGFCVFGFLISRRLWIAYFELEEAKKAVRTIALHQNYEFAAPMQIPCWVPGDPTPCLLLQTFSGGFCTHREVDGSYVFNGVGKDGEPYTFRRRLHELAGVRMTMSYKLAA